MRRTEKTSLKNSKPPLHITPDYVVLIDWMACRVCKNIGGVRHRCKASEEYGKYEANKKLLGHSVTMKIHSKVKGR